MPRRPLARALALATTTLTAATLAASPAAADRPPRTTVSLPGETTERLEICGATRNAARVASGESVTARATRRGRTFRGMLVVQACEDGRWQESRKLGRGRVTFDAPEDADLRVRVLGARPQTVAHVRAGVGEIVDAPFEVAVRNVNRTSSPCAPGAPDGGTYPVRGHLTAPRSALRDGASGALYYHGLSYGEFFWRYRAVAGYDTATELAREGRISVTVDRLGYGESTGPDGDAICYGSQADIGKQLVDALKAGEYRLGGARPVRLDRVALVGHSAGAFIGEMTAYTFDGIDGLAMLSYGDAGSSDKAVTAAGVASVECLQGGEAQDEDGPGGYAFFGATAEDFRRAHLNAPTDPEVADDVAARRSRDPCGDLLSIPPALVVNQIGAQLVRGPVLVMAGEEDALFPPPTVDLQAGRMRAAGADVTMRTVPRTGHAITLGRTAPRVRAELLEWLVENGF